MKIAIVGTAPSSRNLAPFGDESWQIWTCSPGNINVPRSDVWFELHSLDVPWEDVDSQTQIDWIEFLKKQPKVYTARKYPGFVNSEPYPLADIIAKYSQYFLTSTVSLMLAKAITEILAGREGKEGPFDDAIGLCGVDMATNEEYASQRSGCQFFIRECHLNNIAVVIPPESDIAEPPAVYGLCMESRRWRKLYQRERELQGRVAELKAARIKVTTDEVKLTGALEDTQYHLQTWGG